MKKDERREGFSRGNRDMKGAARRTYPVRGDEENSSERGYRGNGYRGGQGRSNAPRVGAVYQNVPAPQRVQSDAGEAKPPRRDFDRKPRYDRAPRREMQEELIPMQENVPVDVILVLAMHFAPVHSKGPAYTARVIQNLYEKKGITSADKAEEHIRLLEKRDILYTDVCRIFALEKDKLTSSEKTMIDAWGERLNMPVEMIKAAFEAAGGNAGIRYCNGILKSWSQKGYKTPEDIQEEFTFNNLSGRNIDRDDDIILQGMNIVPVFEKGE